MKEAAQKNQNVMEQWKALLADASPFLIELVDGLSAFLQVLQKNVGVVKAAIVGLIIFKGLIILTKVAFVAAKIALGAYQIFQVLSSKTQKDINTSTKKQIPLTKKLTAQLKKQTAQTRKLARAQSKVARTQKRATKSGSSAMAVILAMGAAFLMLGVGIALAGVGTSFLIKAFDGLGWASLGAAAALAILSYAMTSFHFHPRSRF